ncbi:hypothetical protein AJ78_01873 [Emergomyces pasteurianus Ep9510]|uniref:Uncharacterized protein n=1 Tax=Emergomyces pasteurianus Ep9510 TaxID=1447872 RepID=A0A1J9QQG5_9EURO|nr:hypothetical protein AJ78_01873 [Emergomyces pasteurianus Ep9510]
MLAKDREDREEGALYQSRDDARKPQQISSPSLSGTRDTTEERKKGTGRGECVAEPMEEGGGAEGQRGAEEDDVPHDAKTRARTPNENQKVGGRLLLYRARFPVTVASWLLAPRQQPLMHTPVATPYHGTAARTVVTPCLVLFGACLGLGH